MYLKRVGKKTTMERERGKRESHYVKEGGNGETESGRERNRNGRNKIKRRELIRDSGLKGGERK